METSVRAGTSAGLYRPAKIRFHTIDRPSDSMTLKMTSFGGILLLNSLEQALLQEIASDIFEQLLFDPTRHPLHTHA